MPELDFINTNHELFSRFSLKNIEDFKKFHVENPQVYVEFRRLSHQMKNTGRKKYSVDAIIHVVRWNLNIQTTGKTFKINNNIRSIYGRLLAYHEPEFIDFFEFRNHGEIGN